MVRPELSIHRENTGKYYTVSFLFSIELCDHEVLYITVRELGALFEIFLRMIQCSIGHSGYYLLTPNINVRRRRLHT